jgi:DNA-binding NarL/FixJ family response regulator
LARILVADDNDIVRRAITHLLRQHEGWEVCGEAVNGLDTVEKVRQLAPDVVVLDFAMPVMNGIEAARQIHEEHPETAILLCSMYLDQQLAALAENVGIKTVLSKSNVSKLIEGVELGLRGLPFRES